jgi:hypothetical protein
LFVIAIASMAEAQVANSFDQLQVLVKPTDTVSVTDRAGREVRGTIAALSSSSLELNVAGNRITFLEGDVVRVHQRRPDSLRNGGRWGFGIGTGVGVLGCLYAASGSERAEFGIVPVCALFYGGLGAGIGAGVDAMIRGTQVIYAKPTGSSARLTLSPVVARDRKGVALSLGF